MVRNFLSLSTLCVVLSLLGCTADNPLTPAGEKTGSLAPQILYKTASGQAGVTITPEILALARTVRVAVSPAGRPLIEKIAPFASGGVVLDGIPVGHANLAVEFRDQNQEIIGITPPADVMIIEGQTARPTLIAHTVKYDYCGWLYGQLGTSYLKMFRADTGLPPVDTLPLSGLVDEQYIDPPVYPDVTFDFLQLLPGKYWLYAYSSTSATDNWRTAVKRAVYTVLLNRDLSNRVIQLDFNPKVFPNGNTLTAGRVLGSTNNENILEIGWWNEADTTLYLLGYYYLGTYDSLEVWKFPNLSDLSAFFSLSYDPYNDYLVCYYWSDENMSGDFDAGDRYYYDEANSTVGIEIGDMTGYLRLPSVTYNRTYDGYSLGKRAALPKKTAAR